MTAPDARRRAEEALAESEQREMRQVECYLPGSIRSDAAKLRQALRDLLAAPPPEPAAASEPVSDPYKLPEEAEEIIYSVADSDCRCGLFLDLGIRCDPCRARAFLASRGGAK